MNWPDEHYVKLYTRDTVTWRSFPWQARCLLPLFLKAADGAGVIETGGKDRAAGLAVLIGVPVEVVAPGLEALVSEGVVEHLPNGLLMPKFIEAQEARKTDTLRKRDQREREIAKLRLVKSAESQPTDVTRRHTASHPVTLQPSPAQPSPEKLAGELLPAPGIHEPVFASSLPVARETRYRKPKASLKLRETDPRHAPLVKALVDACPGYGFQPRDAKAVTALLRLAPPDEVLVRWRRALARSDYPRTRTTWELAANWAHFATDSPRSTKAPIEPTHNHAVGELGFD